MEILGKFESCFLNWKFNIFFVFLCGPLSGEGEEYKTLAAKIH